MIRTTFTTFFSSANCSATLLLLLMLPLVSRAQATLDEAASSYTETFDGVSTGLPTGFSVYSGATSTSLGTLVGFTSAVTNANYATAGFRNNASADGYTSDTYTTAQSTATDRVLGLRQSGTTDYDPGAAFVFTIANTTNITNLTATFKLQSLDVTSARQTTYTVDYAIGNSPTVFTTVTPSSGSTTIGGSTFSNNIVTVAFGSALDYKSGPVYIRIAALNATTGANNRPTTGLDDFTLGYTHTLAPIANAVATNTITPAAYCVGLIAASNKISVPFTSTGTFTSGNVYTAYIGSTAIGTLTSSASGPLIISGNIPNTVVSGTTYRIRVDASNPVTSGTDNGSDLKVVNYKTNEVTALAATPGNTIVDLTWTNPTTCTSPRIVIIARQGGTVTVSPTGTFMAKAQFGSGTDLGSGTIPGQYVVYDGPGTSLTITGLTNSIQHNFKVFTSNGDGFSNGSTVSSTPAAPTVLTEVLLPQYLVGHTAGGSTHTNRLPYAFRATLSGLTPGATYRYYNCAIDPSSDLGATAIGVGNCLFPGVAGSFVRSANPGLSSAGNYGTFQASDNASSIPGSYTGWFMLEPTGNTRFDDSKVLKMRIILNDGNGGTGAVSYLTTTNTVAVRQLGALASQATGVVGSSYAPASNFVFTYDNMVGTGRPLAGTFVESDGTANTPANSYAPFHASSVEGQAGAWGLLTPNDNTNGIRYIAQYDLTAGALVSCPATDADGVWPGGTATASPVGGTIPLTISSLDAPLSCMVYVGFNPATVTSLEGNTSTHIVLVNVTVANTPAGPLTVTVADVGTGTATAGTDYSFVTQTLTFTTASTQTVAMTVNGDLIPEANETVVLNLTMSGTPVTMANSTATVTIGDDDTLPASVLLLEDDFDYSAGLLVIGTTANIPDPTTGWAIYGSASPAISTIAGNVLKKEYPKGDALSAIPVRNSTSVALGNSGQDVSKSFNRPSTANVIYATAVVNVSAAQDNGDYFMNLFDASNPGNQTFRGKVFARSVSGGGINFGLSISANTNVASQVYSTTRYALNTPYLLVLKYENNPATGGKDVASLFVFDDINSSTPQTEPVTPLVGPLTSTNNDFSVLNALALRQGSASGTDAAPIVTVDGVRVATGWGSAVGRPVYTTPLLSVAAGNYYDLTVNNGDVVTAIGLVRVENNLVLTNGRLVSSAAVPVFLYSNAVTTVASNGTSFVSGPLARATDAGARTTIFPIGKGTIYRPLTLTATAQAGTSIYTAEQIEGNPGQSVSASLQRVSFRRFFSVKSSNITAGNFSGTISLSFGSDDYVNVPTSTDLVIAKRDAPAAWFSIGHGAETGTVTGPGGASVVGTLTSNTFSNFSDFVLGALNLNTQVNPFGTAINPLPVELTSFSVQRQVDKVVAVSWTTASEKNSAHFEVQRSLNGQVFAVVFKATAQGTSSRQTVYVALDKTAPGTTLYYRLRQIDRDGTANFSPVVTVIGTANAPLSELTLYPNPTQRTISFAIAEATPYRVLNQLGQVLLQGTTEAEVAAVEVSSLLTGIYHLELQTKAGRVVRKFVRE